MKITHYGHACVSIDAPEGRILIDPGTLAGDLFEVGEVASVLVTHEHPDHLEAAKLADLRRHNDSLRLYVDSATHATLSAEEAERATVLAVEAEQTLQVDGLNVSALRNRHATIYEPLPEVANTAFLIDDRLLHPGDAFFNPRAAVEVLLVPIGAPWLKIAEAIAYLRQVTPRVAIPIHQGGLAPAHQQLHTHLLKTFAPEGTEVVVLDSGTSVDL